ncbi:MAG TPA: hypothetical protein VFQ95_04640 [Rhodanobacteraceae bacterium]|nr:hypothetical protein [Rhodanobacteraceae bacterium]
MSRPLGYIVAKVIVEISGKNDFSVTVTDTQRRRILLGLFRNFYGDMPMSTAVFDTSRIWCSKMALLTTLFPDVKVIAWVREVPWILDSLERLFIRHTLSTNKILNFNPNGTVYSRTNSLVDAGGMVGFALQATKDAFYGHYSREHLMLLRYESLVSDPRAAMCAVYKFLRARWFDHDFRHVKYDANEFDTLLGLPGLHTVRGRVAVRRRKSILPTELFNRFTKESFWLDRSENYQRVLVV